MSAPWGVECPMCHRRVFTTEAPCECGFRFPRGYGESGYGLLLRTVASGKPEPEGAAAVTRVQVETELDTHLLSGEIIVRATRHAWLCWLLPYRTAELLDCAFMKKLVA